MLAGWVELCLDTGRSGDSSAVVCCSSPTGRPKARAARLASSRRTRSSSEYPASMSACHMRLSIRSSSSSLSLVTGSGEAGAVLKLGFEPELPAPRRAGLSSSTVGGVGGRGLAPCAIATSKLGGGDEGIGCGGSKRGGRRALDGEWKGNGGGGSASTSSCGSAVSHYFDSNTPSQTLRRRTLSLLRTIARPSS